MIGRAVSHYQVLSEISRGGMGIVYRALDLKLDRDVAPCCSAQSILLLVAEPVGVYPPSPRLRRTSQPRHPDLFLSSLGHNPASCTDGRYGFAARPHRLDSCYLPADYPGGE
jgi:serine/threonine protein kinase